MMCMTKRLMILLAICSLSLASLNGCTSKESKDDSEIATDGAAASTDATASGDSLDGPVADSGAAAGADAGAAAATSPGTADALPEDSLDADLNAPSDAPKT